ncbi:zinc finger MYM-type protein 1-like [Salvia splendens]|uniref:zinc finger MYM-type protein 1-like n=1 Tax=Salvia splendens TaxID=180675 RepID=UPI001C267AEB|nr:zinc finger MYM-type protein 1-like [Salvia splendens]
MKSHDSSSPSAPNDNVTPSNVSESQAPSNASVSPTPPSVTVTPLNASVSPSPPNVTVTPSNANVSSTRSVPLEEKELIYDVEKLKHDPAKRDSIMKYPPNERDAFRRAYILKKPYNATEVTIREYDIRLKASISCLRYLLRQGLGFRGHRENSESLNRGNFLELLKWLRTHNEVVSKVPLENAPRNCQLISPTIQKDIINCCAKETTKQIVDKLGVDYFAILAEESSDVSQKEQLSLCLRYVQRKTGLVVERFIGLAHVGDTTALSLRSAIISLLMEHSLSPSKIRGQGYDGTSNMKGEIHGLKTLIMEDTPSAYYVHCFAHQLQLTLVAIVKKNDECAWLFDTGAMLLNVVGVSCKRRELIREIQAQKLAQALEVDELEIGFGLNQELGLKRPGDTRWSSHYKTLLNVMDLFSTIFKVLMIIGKDGSKSEDKCKAQGIFYSME